MSDSGLFGIYIGTVVNIDDPLEANRAKIYVPGICEPSTAWARPRGLFGSGRNFGVFGPPPEGSEVLVQFEAGDIDSPWYEPTGASKAEIPDRMKGSLNKWGFGFGDIQFEVELKESGKGVLSIYALGIPDANVITLDSETNAIEIKCLTSLKLSSVGQIDLLAGLVTIQGRPVTPGGKPI